MSHITLLTHELPAFTGILQGTIAATDDASYRKLLNIFIPFIHNNLNNEHWGEQITFTVNNKISLFLVFQGNDQQDIDNTWRS